MSGSPYHIHGKLNRKLPEKKPGRHRFIAIATFTISDETARSSMTGGYPAIMDKENLWDVSIGCIDCEKPWTPELKNFCNAPEYQG